MHEITVGDLMTQDPVCVSPETSIFECAKLMVKKKVDSLIVAEDKSIVGLVTHSDLLWAMVRKPKEELSTIPVADLAKKKVHTLHPDDTIEDAMEKMYDLRLRRLPVVHENKLVGLLTARDVLLMNHGLMNDLHDMVDIREGTKKLNALQLKGKRHSIQEGVCDECGRGDFLFKTDGRMICSNCRDAM